MNFLKRLANLFAGPARGDDKVYWVYVRCHRCGEKIRSRLNLVHDLSVNYGEGETAVTYFTRKSLMGEQRCYQIIEVELTFDHTYKLIGQQIKGGEFIPREEYLDEG